MNNIELQKFIEEKSNRQAILRERMNLLLTLDKELSGSKIGRWFGNVYLSVKRFLTLLLGIVLIIGSVLLFFFPEILFKNENIKKDIIQEYKNNFVQESGASLEVKIHDVSSNYSKTKAITLIDNLDKSIETSIETDTKNKFQFMAILILIMGLIMLYLARLTNKIKLRNAKISNAEKISLSVTKDYGMTIDEEENELIILRKLLNNTPF